jgi:hypothetical protein
MAHEACATRASASNAAENGATTARIGLNIFNFISGNFRFDIKNWVESNNGGLSLQSREPAWRGELDFPDKTVFHRRGLCW